MNSRERVLTALAGRRPDRIPMFEWLVDARIREALCAGGDYLDFVEAAGLDAVVVYADERQGGNVSGTYKDSWGVLYRSTAEEYPVAVGHPFCGPEDLRGFHAPDPGADWRFRSLDQARNRFGHEKAIVFRLRDAYSLPRYLVGMQNLMIFMITEACFVERLVELATDFYAGMARAACERGVDVFWTSDDYCDNRGPVMGIDRWRRFCLGGLRKIVDAVHALGKPFIKHCDGNVLPLLDYLMQAGIDCIDPIDVSAGVSLKQVKQRCGCRLAIKGGLPLQSVLCDGTAEDVQAAVQDCIETAGPQAYILSSSSDITAGVPPGNYRALLEAWRRLR